MLKQQDMDDAAELQEEPSLDDGESVNSDDDDVDDEEQRRYQEPGFQRALLRLQSLWRRFKVRQAVYAEVQQTYEKIWDPRRHRFYYYNKVTDSSRWRKPVFLFGDEDIETISATYTDNEAAGYIQRNWRAYKARRRIAQLAHEIIMKIPDPASGYSYYYNPRTGWTSWEQPKLFGPDDWEKKPGYGQEGDGDDEGSSHSGITDTEDEDDDAGGDEESGPVEEPPRKYPRSKAQVLVDHAKDSTTDSETAVTSLDLSGLDADRITSRVYDIRCLTELNISCNRLTRLSEDLGELRKLVLLDASRNYITKVPRDLEDMTSLQILRLGTNQLESFPVHVYKIANLREMDFSNNRLKQIAYVMGDLELLRETRNWEVGIGLCKQLEVLLLHGNRIDSFPPQVEKCATLVKLTLDHNKLTSVTEDIADLVNLEELGLSYNMIEELPASIGQLKQLRVLNAAGNRLKALPRTLSALKTLTDLILDDNQLESLPDFIGGLVNIRTLSMRNNMLSAVTTKIFSTKIQHLYLDHNRLTQLPRQVGMAIDLELLTLSHNAFKKIPAGFKKLMSLRVLNFSHNMLTSIPREGDDTLPRDELTDLDLSYNELTKASWGIFEPIMIRRLNLSYNRIKVVLPRIFHISSVQELWLDHNDLETLPDTLGMLTRLLRLDLQYNRLTSLPATMEKLVKLKHIDVTGNQLLSVPPWITKLRHAGMAFHLDQNPLTDMRDAALPWVELHRSAAEGLRHLERHEVMEAKGKLSEAVDSYEKFRVNPDPKARPMVHHNHHFNLGVALVAEARAMHERMQEISLALFPPPTLDDDDKPDQPDSAVAGKAAAAAPGPAATNQPRGGPSATTATMTTSTAATTAPSTAPGRVSTSRSPAQAQDKTGPRKSTAINAAVSSSSTQGEAAAAANSRTPPRRPSKAQARRRSSASVKLQPRVDDVKCQEEEGLSPMEREKLGEELQRLRPACDKLLDRALECLTKAEDLRDEARTPGQGLDIVFNRARAHFMRKNMRGAILDLSTVLKAKPRYVPALILMAQVRENYGQYAQARGDCFKILYSKDPSIAAVEGQLLRTKKQAEMGLKMLLDCGVNDPALERTFELTAEGYLVRPRLPYKRVMEDGRSQRKRRQAAEEKRLAQQTEELKLAEHKWEDQSKDVERRVTEAKQALDRIVTYYKESREREDARARRALEERKRREHEAEEEARRLAEERATAEEEVKTLQAEAVKLKSEEKLEKERIRVTKEKEREEARKKQEEEDDARDAEEVAQLLRRTGRPVSREANRPASREAGRPVSRDGKSARSREAGSARSRPGSKEARSKPGSRK